MNRPLVVAITGASGAVYAVRLVQLLARACPELHLVVSPAGRDVLQLELGVELGQEELDPSRLVGLDIPWCESPAGEPTAEMHMHHYKDMMAPIASGSFLTAGMVICPCSGGTLSNVVSGASGNLIHRAADVHLKEGRRLILVPRETPLSRVHLDNMLRARDAGATVLPASPGWYHGVKGLGDLVDFVVARVLDQLEVEHSLMKRWSETADD
jgi:4-hydroxy-3-polyprenylbenzoate decarboxylase